MSAPQSVVDELGRHRIECSSKATGEVSCACRESGWMPFSTFVQHQADAAWKAGLRAVCNELERRGSDPKYVPETHFLLRWAEDES